MTGSMQRTVGAYLAGAALSLALMACGGDESPPGGETTPPEQEVCGEAEIAQCAIDQLGCMLDESDAASCVACESGHYADNTGACVPLLGTPMTHTFPDNYIGPGGEIVGQCRSWTLGNDEPIYLNAVELEQTELSHHSNWTYVPDDLYDGPDGIWTCSDRDYNQLTAALAGGVIYAQSTQAKREVQKFPDGVVVVIPPRSKIISDIHILNTTPDENTGNATITLYGIEQTEVHTMLTPFHVTYDGLALPPQSPSRFSGECELDPQYEALTGAALDMELYYILPHTHALGRRMFVEAIGGPDGDISLVDVRGFNGEARGKQYDPPLDLTGSTGMRFGCEFENPTTETVYWGFDDQEMCEALGFARTPIAFESRIGESESHGVVDGMPDFGGTCSTLAFPWDPEN